LIVDILLNFTLRNYRRINFKILRLNDDEYLLPVYSDILHIFNNKTGNTEFSEASYFVSNR